ncbi:hypothetical protein C8Q77DRAFT_593676 [Trametes polyzona]|nr:hypothetical protein C8Q77DRAFT_593676 [Trametes polyzona]
MQVQRHPDAQPGFGVPSIPASTAPVSQFSARSAHVQSHRTCHSTVLPLSACVLTLTPRAMVAIGRHSGRLEVGAFSPIQPYNARVANKHPKFGSFDSVRSDPSTDTERHRPLMLHCIRPQRPRSRQSIRPRGLGEDGRSHSPSSMVRAYDAQFRHYQRPTRARKIYHAVVANAQTWTWQSPYAYRRGCGRTMSRRPENREITT